jgi:hypothetical protein
VKRGAALRAASAAGGAVGRPISRRVTPHSRAGAACSSRRRGSHTELGPPVTSSAAGQLTGRRCAHRHSWARTIRDPIPRTGGKNPLSTSARRSLGRSFPRATPAASPNNSKKNGLPRASSRPQIWAVPALARPSRGANCSQELLRFPVHNLDRMSCRPISLRR